MPVIVNNVSLEQDTPVLIAGSDNMAQEVHIHNHEHSQGRDLYVGPDSNVSATNGHHVEAESNVVFKLQPGDVLWGMTPDGSGCAITVLAIQKND
jgi:hypothetical protein